MPTVTEHYEQLLAPIYLWMAGGADLALQAGADEIADLGLPAKPGDPIVDLGAGFGMHAVPLARRGANVTAIDSSAVLLRTLDSLRGGLPLKIVRDDLLSFDRHLTGSPAAILCLGDTLLHLPLPADVDTLIEKAAAALPTGGILALSFRDYSQSHEGGLQIIHVRSDAERILTCCLAYETDKVTVHDIVHERTVDGWHMRESCYRKLRLSPETLVRRLEIEGFSVRRAPGIRGMMRLVAVRR